MSKRRAAVFTIVQDEPFFLPIWLKYYERFYDPSDIYVLVHDGGDVAGAANVVPVHNAHSCDYNWLAVTASEFQSFLLQSYDWVLYTDVDEIVFACPLTYPGGLREYIARCTQPTPRCDGFNLIHMPDREPDPIDLSRPILHQRTHMFGASDYCKPLLASHPLAWVTGFHHASNASPVLDKNFILMHLRRIDYDLAYARAMEMKQRNWSERDRAHPAGYQNKLEDKAEFDFWYYHDTYPGTSGEAPTVHAVPDHWRIF